jgi:hypothetical protein
MKPITDRNQLNPIRLRSVASSREMTPALAAGGAAIAVGDLWLVAICWRRRAVLGGVLGAAGISLVAVALASGLSSSTGKAALVIALITLAIGIGLYRLGHLFERLLDEKPDGEI